MNLPASDIVFIDNTVHTIFKSVDSLRTDFPGIQLFANEAEGLKFITANQPAIVFLNLDLVPNDAVTIAKDILQQVVLPKPFIVIYSDKQDDFVYELAFNSGVDSFINFHNKPAILRLFIRNLLSRKKKAKEVLQQNLVVDKERYVIIQKGKIITLPKKEFKLFELLYNNPTHFFTKNEIADQIWHDPVVASKRIIDVHIYNIRRSFGRNIIQSQKGKGYRMNTKLLS